MPSRSSRHPKRSGFAKSGPPVRVFKSQPEPDILKCKCSVFYGDGVLPRSSDSLVVLLMLWWYQHHVPSLLAYAHSDCSGEHRLKGGGRLRVNHQLLYQERRLAICSQLADLVFSVKISDFSYQ